MTTARENPPTSQQATSASALPLSDSVAEVFRNSSRQREVDAWDIVRLVLRLHPEYGKHLGAKLAAGRGPARSRKQPPEAWFAAARESLNRDTVRELHGRLLIVALARLDQSVADYLSADGFLEAVRREIKEPVDSLFRAPSPASQVAAGLPDPAPVQLDNPALQDRLGRRAFARSLAIRLGRIWDEYNQSGTRSSFVLHLHGPWGSGKTSLLNLLRRELQPPERDGRELASRWIVVDFNAWRLQRLSPPWWPLLDAVYRQAVEQVGQREGGFARAGGLRWREGLWRFFTGRRDVVTVAACALLLAAAGYLVLRLAPDTLTPTWAELSDATSALSDIVAIVTALGSALLIGSRSLLPGSTTAVQAFIESATDPIERVARHFRDLLGRIAEPVVVFIDDLDRCQGAYVVTLLEGIQTLFNDPRVVYVISADRRWIYACFEEAYEKFVSRVHEPGRPLGSLFLEKAVQLSVSVPQLSPDMQKAYWDFLVRGEGGKEEEEEELQRLEREVQEEFQASVSEAEVFEKLGAPAASPMHLQLRRQAAVERLASARVEASTSYFLQPFAPLLEPNPRAMKRLLNAYAVQRDLVILAGIDGLANEQWRRLLARWKILSLRWPLLEEYYLQLVTGRAEEPSAEVKALLESDAVRAVMSGGGVGAALDLQAIATLAGLRPSDAAAGVVA